MASEPDLLREFDERTDAFVEHVAKKGKVSPNEYRASGYRAPPHLWADLKTKWRGLRTALGFPIPGDLARHPAGAGLNRDATISYKKGEGAKLRQ
jgi:hypothetical protein